MGLYGDLLELNKTQPTPPPTEEPATPSTEPHTTVEKETPKIRKRRSQGHTMPPRYRGIMTPRNHATVVSRHHDTTVEAIRAAAKLFGKEAATYRFTAEEKKALADLVYTYKRQGIRTSENEITRIGVNFIVVDYVENGENSVLCKVLKALNS